MKQVFFTFLFLLVSVLGIGQADFENEIISCLINQEFKQKPNDTILTRNGRIKKILTFKKPEINLINESYIQTFDSEEEPLFNSLKNRFSSIDSIMCIEFIKNNKTTIKIDSIDFQYSLNYLTKDQIEQIFENGSWENYHKIYEFRPMVQVSRPGLNLGKNKALIYYSTATDGLSARGFYVILEKTKDGWIVKEIMLSWMS